MEFDPKMTMILVNGNWVKLEDFKFLDLNIQLKYFTESEKIKKHNDEAGIIVLHNRMHIIHKYIENNCSKNVKFIYKLLVL